MADNPGRHSPAFSYQSLQRIGGAAAWLVSALTLGEVILLTIFPQPASIQEWFQLFQTRPLIGLLDFWGLEIIMYGMFGLVFLALYTELKDIHPSAGLIALTAALLGTAVFLATNNPFTMLSLSRQHAAAPSADQRAALEAAGEAVLALTNQRAVGGFNIGLLLINTAGLIFSGLMHRSISFRRSTAGLGMLAFGLSAADTLRQALTSSIWIALLVIVPGALLLILWFAIIGRRLIQLGHGK